MIEYLSRHHGRRAAEAGTAVVLREPSRSSVFICRICEAQVVLVITADASHACTL